MKISVAKMSCDRRFARKRAIAARDIAEILAALYPTVDSSVLMNLYLDAEEELMDEMDYVLEPDPWGERL